MKTSASTPTSFIRRRVASRELKLIALITFLAALLFPGIELNESLFAWTRPWEHWQLDELPAVLLVLCACLALFAWRRYREARIEIERRNSAEARMAALLLDNRRLANQRLQAQEAERKVLARELHDELGQYLNAIKIDAVALQVAASANNPEVLRASATIIRHTDHVYAVVRNLIRQLRPIGLDELGLKAAIEHCIEEWRDRLRGVDIDFVVGGDLDSIGELHSLAVYRWVQEGLTNIAKHARASKIGISAQRTAAGEITLKMTDNGRGAECYEREGGLGLIGMRERAEALGGQMQVVTAPARGFQIIVRIPPGDATLAERAA